MTGLTLQQNTEILLNLNHLLSGGFVQQGDNYYKVEGGKLFVKNSSFNWKVSVVSVNNLIFNINSKPIARV